MKKIGILLSLLSLVSLGRTERIGVQNFFDVNVASHVPGNGVLPNQKVFEDAPKRAEGQDCPCGSPGCPSCILAKTERQMHEQALKHARAETKTQMTLVREADLQHRLFTLAQKYTEELKEDEDHAKELSQELQQVTSHAQTLRTKIMKAEYEAKQIAMKAVRTMTIDSQYAANGQKYPGLKVSNAGYDQTTIKEYVPQYQLKIGDTDASGYQDLYQQEVNQDAGLNFIGEHHAVDPEDQRATMNGPANHAEDDDDDDR